MSDLHHLPLMGRDLPEYEPAEPKKRPVRIFSYGPGSWSWEHWCLDRPKSCPVNGYPHDTREEAQKWALKHWRTCL